MLLGVLLRLSAKELERKDAQTLQRYLRTLQEDRFRKLTALDELRSVEVEQHIRNILALKGIDPPHVDPNHVDDCNHECGYCATCRALMCIDTGCQCASCLRIIKASAARRPNSAPPGMASGSVITGAPVMYQHGLPKPNAQYVTDRTSQPLRPSLLPMPERPSLLPMRWRGMDMPSADIVPAVSSMDTSIGIAPRLSAEVLGMWQGRLQGEGNAGARPITGAKRARMTARPHGGPRDNNTV